MTKTNFKFVFPKSSKEYEALVNPMHIEAAAITAMANENTDLAMVYKDEKILLVCVRESEGYKFLYEDKSEETELFMVFGGAASRLAEELDSTTFNERKETMTYDLKDITFHSEGEANAYLRGLADGSGWEGYTSVSEDFYNEIVD